MNDERKMVLGIHDGHTSTACLMRAGKVLANVSEERFTKVKGQGGFPDRALEYLFKEFNIKEDEIGTVALAGLVKPTLSINEYKSGKHQLFPKLIKYFPGDPRQLIKWYLRIKKKQRLNNPELLNSLLLHRISSGKIKLVEHHQCHAATAYYLSGFCLRKEKTLVITLDGSGDGLSGTISAVDEMGKWQRLREISTFDSLGMIYSRTTQLLSMKPWEHEYKLMGMAPYANEENRDQAYKIFSRYIGLTNDGLGLRNFTNLWGNSLLAQMRKDFKLIRFDAISAGVQKLHEELSAELIKNWISKTGIRKVAVSGGCFMNIKANKVIMELDAIEELFVMPSGGDESCALGAAITLSTEKNKNKSIEPLSNVYWGPENKSDDILKTLEKYKDLVEYKQSDDIELESAKLLADHKIIGRVTGRMEWGARALGNRSIIANPSRLENIRILNKAIKMRDFWMPFAPSILWESRKDYAVYEKECDDSLMTTGFNSTELARHHIIAALHPFDLTMRPHFVKNESNPSYHKLLIYFKEMTGIAGVLNTSFNLHGMPIVNDAEDAIHTLLNSELDFITINEFLVCKRDPS